MVHWVFQFKFRTTVHLFKYLFIPEFVTEETLVPSTVSFDRKVSVDLKILWKTNFSVLKEKE
jgi:hypothetical protein